MVSAATLRQRRRLQALINSEFGRRLMPESPRQWLALAFLAEAQRATESGTRFTAPASL
jgi:hypothetical protein